MVVDEQIILQIFGGILKKPSILTEVDVYRLDTTDFYTHFQKILFAALANMVSNGLQRISVADVDTYLQEHGDAYQVFTKNNGIEYLQDAEELSDEDNFEYYYKKLKKFNALRDLQKMGYDTSSIYPEKDMLNEKDYELRENFENLTVNQIFESIKTKMSIVEERYSCTETETSLINKDIRQLIQNLKDVPEVGAPIQGDILNTIFRGARLGKFYLMSSGSGIGKSRTMVGNAAFMAYPIRYESRLGKWVNTGSCEKVMYIGTEQKMDEIQTMIVSYLTDINEEKILYGTYNAAEAQRIEIAAQIMDAYSDNFIFTRLPEPNLAQVKSHIRMNVLSNHVNYVFYDYIFATPSLLNEFRDLAIRPDVALRMLSTLLKDLAAELNVFVMSATQITGKMEFKLGYVRNENMLRDSKSIPDKADICFIRARILPEEMELIGPLCERIGKVPNQVSDVYKVRRGKYVDVRVWHCADLGTCRTDDLFITDGNLSEVNGFIPKYLILNYGDDVSKKVDEFLDLFNDGVATTEQRLQANYSAAEATENLDNEEIDNSNHNAAEALENSKKLISPAAENVPINNSSDNPFNGLLDF